MSDEAPEAAALARWRKAERERLIALRMGLPEALRARYTAAMVSQLEAHLDGKSEVIVSTYWPIRGEPDLRPWMCSAVRPGCRFALPVALRLGEPLRFRLWQPGARMEHGLWRIPHPADGAEVTPDIVCAPLVGFDRCGYRLGYGGGFFDRTLSGPARGAEAIGLGYPELELASIRPQAHDVPMDLLLTGAAAPRRGLRTRR